MSIKLALASVLVASANAQQPIPTNLTQLGWEMGSCEKPVAVIDIYGDFACPDTLASWDNVLLDLGDWVLKNNKAVSIQYHPFPLPYHYNSYRSNLAVMKATNLLTPSVKSCTAVRSVFTKVATQFMRQQAKFYNQVTYNMTGTQVWSEILLPIATSAGLPSSQNERFISTETDRALDLQLRTAWKAACAKGVTGTPIFALNTVVSSELTSWTLSQWKQWITTNAN